jgi:hypothetical protein
MSEVHLLAQQGREKTSARGTSRPGNKSIVKSRILLPIDTRLRCADGQERPISAIPYRMRVFCPQHLDRHHASAFVAQTRTGTPCVCCSTCQATFHVDGYRPPTSCELLADPWENLAKRCASTGGDKQPTLITATTVLSLQFTLSETKFLEDLSGEPVVADPPIRHPLFDFGDQLTAGLHVDCGISMICSPKGTGKTEVLKAKIARWKAAGVTVLALSHRRSLLSALSARLGLTNYLGPQGGWNAPTEHYAVCIDSLGKLSPAKHTYQVVVIDECEQVISHLLSSTMKDTRREIIMLLRHYLRSAVQIVLLDADLGNLSLDVVEEITAGQERAKELHLNVWKPLKSEVHVFDENFPAQIIGDLVESLRDGLRCYVCSNSKADVDMLALQLPKYIADRPLRVIAVTSETVQTREVQSFVRDVTTEILNYDVVITSPSMSTGIDITFAGGASEVDVVYGIFRPLITTHFEIDQQLARVRHPGSVRVWISPEEYEFETDQAAIRAEILASEGDHHVKTGIDTDGYPTFLEDPLYDTIYSAVTALQRASKNQLRRTFLHHKERQGWRIHTVPFEAAHASLGGRLLAIGKRETRELDVAAVVDAGTISRSDYDHLQRVGKSRPVAAANISQMRRFEIEAFYGQEVTTALVDFDDRGRGRARVRNLLALLSSEDEAILMEAADRDSTLVQDRSQWRYKKEVLTRLLSAAGLFAESEIAVDASVEARGLDGFLTALEEEKVALQRIFSFAPRADRHRKPVRQLTDVLRLVGLSLVRAGRDQRGSGDRQTYGIDQRALAQMMEHVQRRRERLQKKLPSPTS